MELVEKLNVITSYSIHYTKLYDRDNKTKYDELMAKRKDVFQKTIPLFEKAYSLDSSDANTKNLLKMAYEITGQKEKADKIN